MPTLPSLIQLPPPVYFLSDAHLGAALVPDPAQQTANLFQWLQEVQSGGKSLVLCGDLFDFWYEWKHVIPKHYFPVLKRLRDLAEKGIAIHYLAGNHDFRLHGFLESEVGMTIHPDTLPADINGEPVFIFHGDGVLARDHGYRLLKKVLRSPVSQRLFSWLHPDLAMGLAHRTSVTSRAMERFNPLDDDEYLAFACRRFAEGYRGVVMGHTHRPVEHIDAPHVYVNLGDWIHHYSYGLHDGSRLQLRRFHPSSA